MRRRRSGKAYRKQFCSIILAAALVMGSVMPAFAAEGGTIASEETAVSEIAAENGAVADGTAQSTIGEGTEQVTSGEETEQTASVEGTGTETLGDKTEQVVDGEDQTALDDQEKPDDQAAPEEEKNVAADQNTGLDPEADEPVEGATVPEVSVSTVEGLGDDDSEELFAEYVERLFEGEDTRKRAKRAVGSKFEGASLYLYTELRNGAEQVASGQRASTEFAFDVEDLGFGSSNAWSASELGIEAVVVDGGITQEAVNAAFERAREELQTKAVTDALLADCPYELYWYDKTVGYRSGSSIGATYSGGEWKCYISGQYTFSFAVASDFSAGQYTADTNKTGAATAAVSNAQDILSAASGLSDIEKLNYYKEEICDLVSYNDAAAGGGVAYGNPWQLVWVFDGDTSTNVVCEGYSKAFQYLCDKTNFSSNRVSAISPTGVMSGGTGEGRHMWNIVTLDDGWNYLADVTNSDSGTVGSNGDLFLVPYTSGSVENGYTFLCFGTDEIHYNYDADCIDLFSAENLTISANPYGTNPLPEPLAITVQPQDVTTTVGQNITLHVEANKTDVSYQWQWSDDGENWENCAFTGSDTDTLTILAEDDLNGKYFRCAVSDADDTVNSDSARVVVALYSGECGDNATWTLDSQGVFTVSGTGEMWDMGDDRGQITMGTHPVPWADQMDLIHKVVFGEGITTVGRNSFNSAANLSDLELPSTLEQIHYFAFYKCSSLDEINLPEGLTTIQQYAFHYTAIETLNIPGSVGFLDGGVCEYCPNLKSIYIKKHDVGNFIYGDSPFPNNPVLEGIYVEDGHMTFYDIDGVLYDRVYSKLVQYPGGKKDESFTVPEGIEIFKYAFRGTQYLKHVDLTNMTVIPKFAFYGCTSLNSITFSDSLTSIQGGAFGACKGLTSVTIPESVGFIGGACFDNCTSLAEITLPENLSADSLETNCFAYCPITSITIPNGVAKISNYCFNQCTELESVIIPNSVTSIGERAFYDCNSLTSIDIPDSVTEIGNFAFSNCESLVSVALPESLNSISNWLFSGCENLESVDIPDSVTSIGNNAFHACYHLKSLVIPDSVTSIGTGAFSTLREFFVITVEGSYAITYCEQQDPPIPYVIICKTHTWEDEYTVDKEATCTEEGSESIHCSVCGEIDETTVRVIPKTEHAYGDWTVTKEATCTEDGSREKICANCGDKVMETIPAGHIWEDEYTVDKEATCGEEGSESIHCSVCDAIDETTVRVIPKTEHAYGDWTVTKEATCTEDGSKEKICVNCGDKITETISATGHVWEDEYTVDKEATCSEEGSESIHCSVCDAIDETTIRAIAKTEHAYGDWTVTKEATCTEDGSREKACGNCGDKITETIPAIGHAYGDWTVTKEATCTEDGSKEKVCANCGDKITETIPATGHIWEEEYTVDKEATCSEEGSESIHCSVCNAIDETTIRAIAKTEHAYGDWTVTKEATCTEDGSREKVCANCGDKVTETIVAIGHIWEDEYTVDKEATCSEEGSESIHCSVCDASDDTTIRAIAKTEHAYGDWTVTKEATCTEDGSREKVCTNCGDKVTETISATGHAYSDWTVTKEATCTEAGSKEKVCANCGDKITEEIPATGHAWSEWIVVREATEEEEGLERRTCSNDPSHTEERTIPKLTHVHELTKTEAKEASCTEDGNIEFWTCSKCGRVYSDSEGVNNINLEETVIHAAGHKWNTEYTVDKEATCKEEGSESIHCSVCDAINETTVRVIPMKEHAYGDWTVTKEATCTEDGSREKVCANCGDKITETIPAIGHAYGDWTVTKEATCIEDGSREKVCGNCGDKITETIAATGHVWEDEYTVDKEATCKEEGSESIHCSVCDAINETTVRVIPMKEHAYGDWTVTKEATCTEDGSREKVCANCGDKITETIPATGHAYGDWTVIKEATCTEDGSREKVCANCGDKVTETISATGHVWEEEYTVDKEATYTEEGSESIHCSVCDAINESTVRPIPVLKGTWKQDRNGWWYDRGDGTYPKDGFEEIEGTTYYFNASGYMKTGWVEDDGDWYYFAASGAMVKDSWQQSGSTWYYFGEDGKMLTGLQEINGTSYFFKDSGAMATGWQQIDGDWYYFNAGGAMVKENWLSSGGKWYYFDESGKMVTDFKEIGDNEYYFNASGAMLTGWQQIEGAWYYFEASGAMVRSRWVGNYYLDEYGEMATNRWIGEYYVGPDGKWIPGMEKVN